MSEEYLAFAKQLALDSGKIMLEYFGKASGHYKEDNTIVTEADTKINQLLIGRVREKYPEHGVYGEEDSFGKDRNELWVCDPLDGTLAFSNGIPVATFSLAYVVDGKPVLGVICDPFTNRLYSAVKGGGAFCNNEPIHVDDFDLADKRSTTNFVLPPKMPYDISKAIYELMRIRARVNGIPTVVGQGALVARGASTASIVASGRAYDVASVEIIVEEAGGKVTNLLGEEQRYDGPIRGAIISNGKVHDELVAISKANVKENR